MASGTHHDRLILSTTPIAALAAYAIDPAAALPLTASYLLGGLFLSPDLDTPSKPFHRWKGLKAIWLPYQKLCKHRGTSHWLVIGTLGRVLYLGVPLGAIGMLAGIELAGWVQEWRSVLIILIGLELSAWTHLAADGLLFK